MYNKIHYHTQCREGMGDGPSAGSWNQARREVVPTRPCLQGQVWPWLRIPLSSVAVSVTAPGPGARTQELVLQAPSCRALQPRRLSPRLSQGRLWPHEQRGPGSSGAPLSLRWRLPAHCCCCHCPEALPGTPQGSLAHSLGNFLPSAS